MIRSAEFSRGAALMHSISAIGLLAAALLGATNALAGPPTSFDQNRAAWEAFRARDFSGAEQKARAAWTTAEAQRKPLQSAFAAANLAAALAMRGRLDEARAWSLRAEERLAGGPAEVRGRLLAARAMIEITRGDEAASKQALADAKRALGPKDWRLRMLSSLILVHADLEIAAGYEELRALREAARAAGNAEGEAVALTAVGWVEGLGGAESAVTAYERARELFAASGHAAILPLMDHDIGAVFLRAGKPELARAPLERGLEAARKGGDVRTELILLDDLSQAFVRTGDGRRAREADLAAAERLARIAEDVRAGKLEDSLLLDLRHLSKLRYVNQPSLLVDLFVGLADQLALEPATEAER